MASRKVLQILSASSAGTACLFLQDQNTRSHNVISVKADSRPRQSTYNDAVSKLNVNTNLAYNSSTNHNYCHSKVRLSVRLLIFTIIKQ